MGIVFDRESPGGGVEAVCTLENGKVFLEWHFCFRDSEKTERKIRTPLEPDEDFTVEKGMSVRLLLMDAGKEVVLECEAPVCEEEPLRSVLLQPRLWNGLRDPYLYRAEVFLRDGRGRCLDRVSTLLPLRSLEAQKTGEKDAFLLNGTVVCPRMVRYRIPSAGIGANRQRMMLEDLRHLCELGANCMVVERKEGPVRLFLQLCDRMGILVFLKTEAGLLRIYGQERKWNLDWEGAPVLRGTDEGLLSPEYGLPTALFYQYRAKWGKAPFVRIIPESIHRLESGNYEVLCYSNCSRVALYSDGSLFGFQSGEGTFRFREVPARFPGIMLTAEGDGCSQSLSVQKSFLNSHAASCSTI